MWGRQDARQAPQWRDAQKSRSGAAGRYSQLMCECCGFCLTVAVQDPIAHRQLQSRFENRCPVMLFSQMVGLGAGRVARSDAYSFLKQRAWETKEIVELLDRLDADNEGNVDKEALVRAHEAMKSTDGARRDVASALGLISQERLCIVQMRNALVPPKDAHSPQSWHEQACLHLGLKGTVRLGHEDDLLAYIDGLIHANVSGTEGIAMAIRHVAPDEVRVNTLDVTSHHSKKELMRQHVADIEALNCPVLPPYSLQSEDEDEAGGQPHGGVASQSYQTSTHNQSYQTSTHKVHFFPPRNSAISNGSPPVDTLAGPPSIATPNQDSTATSGTDLARRFAPGSTATALYAYSAREPDELSLVAGEVVKVVASHDDGWYLVQNASGAFGVVPGNYLYHIQAGNGAHKQVESAGGEGRSVVGARQSEEAFLGALRKSEEATHALEASIVELSAAASSPWIMRKASSLSMAVEVYRQKFAGTRTSLLDVRAAFFSGQAQERVDPSRMTTSNNELAPFRFENDGGKWSGNGKKWQGSLGTMSPQDSSSSDDGSPHRRRLPRVMKRMEGQIRHFTSPGRRSAFDYSGGDADGDISDKTDQSDDEDRGYHRTSHVPDRSHVARRDVGERVGETGIGYLGEVNGSAGINGIGTVNDIVNSFAQHRDKKNGFGYQVHPADTNGADIRAHGTTHLEGTGKGPGEWNVYSQPMNSTMGWSLHIELLTARDLPATDKPYVICCVSLVKLPKSGKVDVLAHYQIEHNQGVDKLRHTRALPRIEPQQKTTPAAVGSTPEWKQSLVFKDAYPSLDTIVGGASTTGNIPADWLSPLDGHDVILLLTVHDALGTGREEFMGKIALPVKVCHPSDNWVVLRARDGGHLVGEGGRNPAVLMRVGYMSGTSDLADSPPWTAAAV